MCGLISGLFIIFHWSMCVFLCQCCIICGYYSFVVYFEVREHGAVLKSLSHVRLFTTPWTAVCQASLSSGILQARLLEWVAMPSSRYLPNPGIEPMSPTLQADSLWSEPPGKFQLCLFSRLFWLFKFFCGSIQIIELLVPVVLNMTVAFW